MENYFIATCLPIGKQVTINRHVFIGRCKPLVAGQIKQRYFCWLTKDRNVGNPKKGIEGLVPSHENDMDG